MIQDYLELLAHLTRDERFDDADTVPHRAGEILERGLVEVLTWIQRGRRQLLEREHQEVAMVIYRADRHTGAAHDAFVGETRHQGGNLI